MISKIYLSPSNQTGNMYAGNITNECDNCNRIADAAKKALERCGFTVKKAPKGQEMSTSIAESNEWGADLHIPIHTNAFDTHASGTVVFVYSTAAENMKYAMPIYNAVQAAAPGTTNYGVRTYPELSELCNTNAIAVYVEVDFHDNPKIAPWLVKNTEAAGEAIAVGVCNACGRTYKPKTPVTHVSLDELTESDYAEIERAIFRAYEKKAKEYISRGCNEIPKTDYAGLSDAGYSPLAISYFIKKLGGG